MDLGIAGRVALVTGASSGLGLGIARALVAEGAKVAISSRSWDRISEAATLAGASPFVFDADDPSKAGALIAEVEAGVGPVEILVANSGGPPVGPDALGFDATQWEAAYRTLVRTPIELARHAVPGMRARGWGRILASSSSVVREPLPNLVLSNVHRSALLGAFKTLARQVAPDGVTVNTLLPGRIDTDRLRTVYGSQEAVDRMAREEIPAGRLGRVEEYAAAAAFLCSERASYITGVALLVDGGLTRGV
jgi:3-oxoacyl-[acyl-carrier protein] reductase